MIKERDSSLDNERDTGRLEAFSDGVIAVAITLLILDLHVPPVIKNKALVEALLNDGIYYLGYVISFTIIGLYWANHHYMYKYIRRTDHFLLSLNTLALMCLVLIPFTTSLLVTHFNDTYANNANWAAVVYSASLLLVSIMYNIVWWYASTHRSLLVSGLTSQVIEQMTRRYFVSIPLYVVTLIVSYFNVTASLMLYIAIAVVYALPANLLPFGRQRSSRSEETAIELQKERDEEDEIED